MWWLSWSFCGIPGNFNNFLGQHFCLRKEGRAHVGIILASFIPLPAWEGMEMELLGWSSAGCGSSAITAWAALKRTKGCQGGVRDSWAGMEGLCVPREPMVFGGLWSCANLGVLIELSWGFGFFLGSAVLAGAEFSSNALFLPLQCPAHHSPCSEGSGLRLPEMEIIPLMMLLDPRAFD